MFLHLGYYQCAIFHIYLDRLQVKIAQVIHVCLPRNGVFTTPRFALAKHYTAYRNAQRFAYFIFHETRAWSGCEVKREKWNIRGGEGGDKVEELYGNDVGVQTLDAPRGHTLCPLFLTFIHSKPFSLFP